MLPQISTQAACKPQDGLGSTVGELGHTEPLLRIAIEGVGFFNHRFGGIAACGKAHRWVLVFGQLHQDGGQAIGVAHLLVIKLLLPLFSGCVCSLIGGNVVLTIHQR